MRVKIALAGNPNSGKTTLFNALTGSNQFVGNWPGVTVEKKEGKIKGYTAKGEEAILVDLPGDVLAPVLKTEGEQVYLCQDYENIIETRSAGDLPATVEAISGFSPDEVTMVTSTQENQERHEFVWACVGEAGDRIGRAVILDDGSYHYCMSVLRDAKSQKVSQISWDDVFSSFRIAQETPGTEV